MSLRAWDEAEVIGEPVKAPRDGAFLPRVLVKRRLADLHGPRGEFIQCVHGAGTAISLFTGAGGFDLGLEQAGFVSVVQHEWDVACCETLIVNRPHAFRHAALIQGDICYTPTSMILGEAGLRVGEADIVCGGPPCQGFSTANSNRPRAEREGDHRNDLVFQFLRVVGEARPKFFIFENVPGFLSFNKGAYFQTFLRAAFDRYYELVYGLINAVEYGVPQNRCRFICMGTRRDLFEIEGTLGGLPAPQTLSKRDLKRIEIWTPSPLFKSESLELLLHPPGIRYFPDRPVLVPPRPIAGRVMMRRCRAKRMNGGRCGKPSR